MRGRSSSNSTIWPPACAVVATVGIEPLCATGPSPLARPVAESFFNLLKRERIRRKKYKTREEARRDVFPARAYFVYPAGQRTTSRSSATRSTNTLGTAWGQVEP